MIAGAIFAVAGAVALLSIIVSCDKAAASIKELLSVEM